MAGANTLTFDDGNFDQEVLKSDTPVLVDFWAEWCGPCQLLGPTIDELANELHGKVKVGKVNIDVASNVASRYGIRSIPTVMVFHKGVALEQMVGVRKKSDYENVLKQKAQLA